MNFVISKDPRATWTLKPMSYVIVKVIIKKSFVENNTLLDSGSDFVGDHIEPSSNGIIFEPKSIL